MDPTEGDLSGLISMGGDGKPTFGFGCNFGDSKKGGLSGLIWIGRNGE